MFEDSDLRLWLLVTLDGVSHLNAWYCLLVTLAYGMFLACALWPAVSSRRGGNRPNAGMLFEAAFLASLALFIFMARWPGLLASLLNYDEAYFIAAAMKLLRDPVFWRSADVSTSGPLNIYPLILPALFGLRIEYASARLLGLTLMIASCVCLYLSIKSVFGSRVARLAQIPVATTVALMTTPDYVHYNSETVSIAITSLALLGVCRVHASSRSADSRLLFVVGALLGSVPYAKLQAVPIAGMIACLCTHATWEQTPSRGQFLRGMAVLCLGGIFATIIVAGLVVANGVHDTFLRSYVLQNVYFSNFDGSLAAKLENFLRLVQAPPESRVLFTLAVTALIIGVPLILTWRRPRTDAHGKSLEIKPRGSVMLWYGVALLAAAVYSVAQPQRNFYHYAMFLIIPSGFVVGAVLGELDSKLGCGSRQRRWPARVRVAVCVTLVAISELEFGRALLKDNVFIATRAEYRNSYVSPSSRAILKYASPGDSMAIWGWSPELHVETGVVQATSESIPVWQFRPNPMQDYFVTRFADELRSSNAALFVDTQLPGNLAYEWMGVRGRSFEEIPEIADVVAREFQLVRRIDGVRIYARRQLQRPE